MTTEVTAQLNYLRIAPRKVRLIADLIRGKSCTEAERELQFLIKRPSAPVLKLLKSALASAKQNQGIEAKDLYIKKIDIDEGPPLKRFMPRAMGRAFLIKKRTSHIMLVLGQRAPAKAEKEAAKDKKKKQVTK